MSRQQRKRPRPRGWHEWLADARREASAGKHLHGRAVVRAVKHEKAARKTYTRRDILAMSEREFRLLVAERLGIVRE